MWKLIDGKNVNYNRKSKKKKPKNKPTRILETEVVPVNGNPTRWTQCQPYPSMLKPIAVPSLATTSFGKCPTKKRCHTIDKSIKLINIAQSVLCLTPANTWMQNNTH